MRPGPRSLPLLVLLAVLPVPAAEILYGSIGAVTGEDWRISGLRLAVDLTGDVPRGVVNVAALELPDAGLSFADSRVACGRIGLSSREFACREASITVDLPEAGRQTFSGEFAWVRASGDVRFALQDIPVAGGTLNVRGTATKNAVAVEFGGTALQLAALPALLARFAPEIAGLEASGHVDLEGSLRTRDGHVAELEVRGDFGGASVSNEAGTIVAASADVVLDLRASHISGGWRFAANVSADGGEAYVEPIYVNLSDTPVSLSSRGTASADFDGIAVESFTLRQGSLVAAKGSLDARPSLEGTDALVSGRVELENTSVEALYSGLLKVFAAGTLFGDLETDGIVSGAFAFTDNALASADLVLEDVIADDRQGRFSVHGLSGSVHWPGPPGEPGDAPPTALRWEAASAYDVPFAGGSVALRLGGNDVELVEPLRVATMGGAVRVNRLSVTNFGEAEESGLLDAALEPVQLGQLTAAFGWPAFSGTLSGELPLLQYDGGVMTLGGTLTARAFDGDIEFSNLRLEQPFGLVPRLSGDLRLRGLDLELVTNTFSFGLIQGRLSGDVRGLQLEGWRPVAMDLHLYTPPGDDSRRRISQRAVENLASVGGGGAAAALSSGFMKFFEVFAYDEIGIRCILAEGTCVMSGAGPAGRGEPGGGYYIVRGSGLPRIDVVGYRTQVSWQRLVRQLENIIESGAPIVE